MDKLHNLFHTEKALLYVMVLASSIILGCTYYFSGQADLTRAKEEMKDTAAFVHSEYHITSNFNQVTVMQSLNRVIDKVHQVQRRMREDPTLSAERLRDYVEELRLTGVVVISPNGKVLVSSGTDEGLYEKIRDSVQRRSVLNIGSRPLKTYGDRIYMDDQSYVDMAAVQMPGSQNVIVGYYHTSVSYAKGLNLSLDQLLAGFKNSLSAQVVITDGTYIIANNDTSDANNPMYQAMIERVREYKNLHPDTSDEDLIRITNGVQAGVTSYYAMVSKGRNYFVYIFVPEKEIFTTRNRYMLYTLLACALFILAVILIRQQSFKKEEEARREKDANYEKQLVQKAQEAEVANQSKTDFLRRMSHDIRTPINGIRGMIEIAEHYADDLKKQQEARQKIWQASGYLLELINEVLEINRLESGRLIFEKKSFHLQDLCHEIQTLTEKQTMVGHITIEKRKFDLKHDWFIGSPLHIKRIMMNIISNAIKYNKDYGHIYVSLQEFPIDDTHSRILFTCEDTGFGMTEEFQKRMFEPFAQESTGARTHFTGTGLGLAIVKRMIDQMGGTISCQSQVGKGSTFTISLPLEVDTHGAERAKAREAEVRDIRGIHALLVEDNDLNIEIAQFFLENAGVKVDMARNGQEAVTRFAASDVGSYDVILMDIMMPVMDGLEATRTIRKMPRSDATTVPIIAMTANAFQEDRQRVLEAGMNEHLTKPLESEKLIATIGQYVK